MTHEQKTAMARIISDMIKADNVIEESEIKDMKRLMTCYSLTQRHMYEARRMRFSEAVNILGGLSKKERERFFDDICGVSLSDGMCVPREAMLLLALQYCLLGADGKNGEKPYLLSCATGEGSLNDLYMVYVENALDEGRNRELMKDFRLIVTQCRLSGFNFIYIPKMVDEFRMMDTDYVKDVLKYMAPNLEEGVVDGVYDKLCHLTTSDFFCRVLKERLQMRIEHDMPPSLLVNIGTSVVPYYGTNGSVQYYTEFLCLPIRQTTLGLVDEVLAFYQRKVSVRTVTVTDNRGQFKYFGFYKALFDFLITPPPVAPDLVFLGQDMTDGKYYVGFRFCEKEMHRVNLTPKWYKLFLNIAYRTFHSRTKGLPVAHQDADRTAVAHIRKTIAEEMPVLTFVDLYRPERDGNVYVLRLDKNKVFVRSDDVMHPADVPMAEYKMK